MNNNLLKIIKDKYELIDVDMGELKEINKKGMHFNFNCYDIPNVGRLSIFDMKAMLGIMKMESVILVPLNKNMPLFSFDGIQMLKNYILLLELYNTSLEDEDVSALQNIKDEYKDIKDGEVKPNWYDNLKLSPTLKKASKVNDLRIEELVIKFFKEYLVLLDKSKECDFNKKRAKSNEYVTGLLNNGGPAANQIKKLIGEEKTEILFKKYLFGTDTL